VRMPACGRPYMPLPICMYSYQFMGVEAEVLNVGPHKWCILGGYDTVEEAINGLELGGGCADFAFVINMVAVDNETYMLRFSFEVFESELQQCTGRWKCNLLVYLCGK
jgi:hypothetical protein